MPGNGMSLLSLNSGLGQIELSSLTIVQQRIIALSVAPLALVVWPEPLMRKSRPIREEICSFSACDFNKQDLGYAAKYELESELAKQWVGEGAAHGAV